MKIKIKKYIENEKKSFSELKEGIQSGKLKPNWIHVGWTILIAQFVVVTTILAIDGYIHPEYARKAIEAEINWFWNWNLATWVAHSFVAMPAYCFAGMAFYKGYSENKKKREK